MKKKEGLAKKVVMVLVGIIVLIGVVYAVNVLTSEAWHVSQEITNSGGRVFDSRGRAYRCDAVGVAVLSPGVEHKLSQIAMGLSDLRSVDNNGNGLVDVGLSLSNPSSRDGPLSIGHDISEIDEGGVVIDADGNGWPDSCDCVLSLLNEDESNCGSCGNVCASGRTCCSGGCKNLQTDEDNCGSCGRVCSSGLTCCSGDCKNLQTDNNNCGLCGNVCAGEDTCVAGVCETPVETIDLSVDSGCQSRWPWRCSDSKQSGSQVITKSMSATFTVLCDGHWGAPSACWGRIYKNGAKIREVQV